MKEKFKILKIQKKDFIFYPFVKKMGGFTLIESLMGITILLVAVIGPLYIAFQGVSLSILAKNQVIASYLAQEGIEFVRFRIITNSNMGEVGNGLILPADTSYGLGGCSFPNNGGNSCMVDVFNNLNDGKGQVANCFVYGGECPYIKYNSTDHTYNYSDGDETFFRRSICIKHNNGAGDTEFQVESEVEWGRPDNLHNIVIKEVIRDWRP